MITSSSTGEVAYKDTPPIRTTPLNKDEKNKITKLFYELGIMPQNGKVEIQTSGGNVVTIIPSTHLK